MTGRDAADWRNEADELLQAAADARHQGDEVEAVRLEFEAAVRDDAAHLAALGQPVDLERVRAGRLADLLRRKAANAPVTARRGDQAQAVTRELIPGDVFLLERPTTVLARWGKDDEVAWAAREPMILAGPPGVGKTTLMGQLITAGIGLGPSEVLGYPVAPMRRVLLLAADRPDQIARAIARTVRTYTVDHDATRELLRERLVVWKGPPPRDVAKHPETLLELAQAADADVVIPDSLKDMALDLSSDETGSGVNRAMQLLVADDRDVMVPHHQRKGANGQKPKTLEDVYGSTWITAGAGSVVLLWGEAGDLVVDLIHLKQPAAVIGPLRIEHDHNRGVSTVERGQVDPLVMLRHAPHGLTPTDIARAMTGSEKPNDTARRRALRSLDRLVEKGHAHKVADAELGGPTGTRSARYVAAAIEPQDASKTTGQPTGHADFQPTDSQAPTPPDTEAISPGQATGHTTGPTGQAGHRTPPPPLEGGGGVGRGADDPLDRPPWDPSEEPPPELVDDLDPELEQLLAGEAR